MAVMAPMTEKERMEKKGLIHVVVVIVHACCSGFLGNIARYVKMTQRVGLRFAEHQALQQQQQQQTGSK